MADGGANRPGRPAGGYTQVGRVLRMWALLTEWHRIEDLAEDLDVTTRTVRRDLHALRAVCPLELDRGDYRRVDRQTTEDARADGAAAERARCIEVVTALLREVEGPAARAPESHAGGEASALRRAVAALGALS